MNGLQRRYKSGACDDYFQVFGYQDDPKVRDRQALSLKDRIALHRMQARARASNFEARMEARRKAKTAALKKAYANEPKQLGTITKLKQKLKSFKAMLLGGFQK